MDTFFTWAVENTSLVEFILVAVVGWLNRDLRAHMKEEKTWRIEFEQWRIEHLTDHV